MWLIKRRRDCVADSAVHSCHWTALAPPPPVSQSGRDRQWHNNVSSVGHFVIEYARLFWLGFLHAGYHFKELKQSFLFRFRTLGGCFSEFSFDWLLKLVESFIAIIYVRSDSAYFDRQSNENSLRQPPRFCNAKKGLFKLFKMPYSKSKSEQKRGFKLKKKLGDQNPTFTKNVRKSRRTSSSI